MAQTKCIRAFLVDLCVGHRCREHGHPYTEIVFNDKCAGFLYQGGTRVAYGPNSVFIYQPGLQHWIVNHRAGRQTCIEVICPGSTKLPPIVSRTCAQLRRYFADIAQELRKPKETLSQERLDYLAGLIVVSLLRAAPPSRQAAPSKAQAARGVIDARFHEPLDVATLANQVRVNPDYLRQLFRKEFGESIIHYLIRRRIEFAAQLLRSSAESVNAIAAQAGFSDPYYFSRAFHKSTGQSPSEFRTGAHRTVE